VTSASMCRSDQARAGTHIRERRLTVNECLANNANTGQSIHSWQPSASVTALQREKGVWDQPLASLR
jgi:hypothetical protein